MSTFKNLKPWQEIYPIWWLIGCLLLVGLDIGSKKWITNHLNFFLNQDQMRNVSAPAFAENSALANSTVADVSKNQVNLIGGNGKIMKLRLVFNDRFIFGLGPNTPIIGFLLTLIATLLLFFVRWLYYRGNYIAWMLIFAGALGNLTDKMFVKSLLTREWVLSLVSQPNHVQGVVDFFECIWFGIDKWQNTFLLEIFAMETWPTFNFADSYIVVGVIVLLINYKS